MPRIHFCDGEKGGVGKSFFCKVLIEYFRSRGIDYYLVDTDRTNPDVGLIYEPSKYKQLFKNRKQSQTEPSQVFVVNGVSKGNSARGITSVAIKEPFRAAVAVVTVAETQTEPDIQSQDEEFIEVPESAAGQLDPDLAVAVSEIKAEEKEPESLREDNNGQVNGYRENNPETYNSDIPSAGKQVKNEEDQPFQHIIFSEDDVKNYGTDDILEMAFEKDVIVNLPAQVSFLLDKWILGNNLSDLKDSYEFEIVKWFVCSPDEDSLALCKKSLKTYGVQVKHILVKNRSFPDMWGFWAEDAELQELIKENNVKVISLPKCSPREAKKLDQNGWTFTQALQKRAELKVMGLQRLKNFIKEAFAQIQTCEEFLVKKRGKND